MANWVKNLLEIEDKAIKESAERETTYTCKYISSLLNQKIEIKLKQLKDDDYKSFMAMMVNDDESQTAGEKAIENENVFAQMVTYSLKDREILSNEMMNKFHVCDTLELIKKIFPGSEIFDIGGKIVELCEYELPKEIADEKKTGLENW